MTPERIAALRYIWHDFGMRAEADEMLDEIERLRGTLRMSPRSSTGPRRDLPVLRRSA